MHSQVADMQVQVEHRMGTHKNEPDRHVMRGDILHGRYQLGENIGNGGFSEIFTAVDLRFQKLIAVKVCMPHLISNYMYCSRFVKEATALALLKHQNLLNGLGLAVFDNGTLFFPMEYVDGRTLRAFMYLVRLVPTKTALNLAMQLCDALIELHRNLVVHRDLSPANILLADNGTLLKLGDLGLLKCIGDIREESGSRVGTYPYMAPEYEPDTDHRVDIYSFGILMYEMLCGHRPEFYPARLSTVNRDIHHKIEDVVMQAIRKNPEDRFQTAEELKEALTLATESMPKTKHIRLWPWG